MKYAMLLAAGLLFAAPAAAKADDCVVVRPRERRIVVVERPRPCEPRVVVVEPCRPVVRVIVHERHERHCR
ncbi:MAG TPA: hypothetical protein VFF73_22225 [Planctomycetota bacterium]|nr:hypothetical protein [Planctomycetota bacterium]